MPLRLLLPEGKPYSFFRKYLLRPPQAPLAAAGCAEGVRRAAMSNSFHMAIDITSSMVFRRILRLQR